MKYKCITEFETYYGTRYKVGDEVDDLDFFRAKELKNFVAISPAQNSENPTAWDRWCSSGDSLNTGLIGGLDGDITTPF